MKFYRWKNYQLVFIPFILPKDMENGYKDIIDWLHCLWTFTKDNNTHYGIRIFGISFIFSNFLWEIKE